MAFYSHLIMSLLDKFLASCVPLVPKKLMRPMATRYIAGEQRIDALNRAENIVKKDYDITFDLLGEAVTNKNEVIAASDEYLALLKDIKSKNLPPNISLKPTQMGLDIDKELCFQTVSNIVAEATQYQGFVRLEMESSKTVDGTLDVFHQLHKQHGKYIGCVLQAMLHRTHKDAEKLLTNNPQQLNVRMVKGIYVEPESIAFQDPKEINQSYLKTTKLLLENGAFVAAATHDPNIISGLNSIISELPEAKDRIEIQMLLGVQGALRQELLKQGFRVRVYIPYGEAWHKYVIRRLKRNPKLARFALTGMFQKSEI